MDDNHSVLLGALIWRVPYVRLLDSVEFPIKRRRSTELVATADHKSD
jgi:hypothetical protein